MSDIEDCNKLLEERKKLIEEYKHLCDVRADIIHTGEEKLSSFSGEIGAIRSGVAIKKDLIDLFEQDRECGSTMRVLVPGYFYTTDTHSGISSVQSSEDLK